MADLTPGTQPPGPIRLPGWQDILHITPRADITRDDRRAWNAYMDATNSRALPVEQLRAQIDARARAGERIGALTDAQITMLLRGRQIYQDMQRSQIPAWRQKMMRVLVTLDNVEDQISTIEWVTRPVTNLWAPTKALSLAARRTSTALDTMQRIIAGPSIARFNRKRRAARDNQRSSRAATGKLGKLWTGIAWAMRNKGKMLEGAQALDTWTGVGLSLGAIFGALEETQDRLIISAWEGAKFAVAGAARALLPRDSELNDILERQQQANIQRVRETGAPLVAQMWNAITPLTTIVPPFTRLFRALTGATQLQRDNDTYTRAEHALALYHGATLLPLLAQTLPHLTHPRVLARLPSLLVPRPRVPDSYTRDLLEEAGARFSAADVALGEWSDPPSLLIDQVDAILTESEAARATWLPETYTAPEDALLHALVEACAPGTSTLLAGDPDALHIIPDPASRAEILAHHLDATPPPDTSSETLAAWLAAQEARIREDPDTYDWRAWTEVTERYWSVAHLHIPGATRLHQLPLTRAAA